MTGEGFVDSSSEFVIYNMISEWIRIVGGAMVFFSPWKILSPARGDRSKGASLLDRQC